MFVQNLQHRIEVHMPQRSLSFIMLIIIGFAFSGCAVRAPQINVRVNGVGLPQQAQMGKLTVGSNEVTVYWFYARHFDRTLQSKTGVTEVIPDRQPLAISDKPQRLPADTKEVGIVVSIDNPTLQKYRLSKVTADANQQGHSTVYEGIRDYQEIFVPGVINTARNASKVGVNVEVIGTDNATVVDTLYLGDLMYSIGVPNVQSRSSDR